MRHTYWSVATPTRCEVKVTRHQQHPTLAFPAGLHAVEVVVEQPDGAGPKRTFATDPASARAIGFALLAAANQYQTMPPNRGEPVHCSGCHEEIDPETCCCGAEMHLDQRDGHAGVPMGCRCFEDPGAILVSDEKRIATIAIVETPTGVEVRAAFDAADDVVFPAKDVDNALRLLRRHAARGPSVTTTAPLPLIKPPTTSPEAEWRPGEPLAPAVGEYVKDVKLGFEVRVREALERGERLPAPSTRAEVRLREKLRREHGRRR